MATRLFLFSVLSSIRVTTDDSLHFTLSWIANQVMINTERYHSFSWLGGAVGLMCAEPVPATRSRPKTWKRTDRELVRRSFISFTSLFVHIFHSHRNWTRWAGSFLPRNFFDRKTTTDKQQKWNGKLETECNIDFFRGDYSSSLSWICTGAGGATQEVDGGKKSSLGRCLAPCFPHSQTLFLCV